MRGMWNVLERAGLVRNEGAEPAMEQPPAPGVAADTGPGLIQPAALEQVARMPLEKVYQAAGVPEAPYPAERLFRLIEGLKAMDESTRRQAIRAMDAADDSWTIDDPIRDASAKVAAIEAHASGMRTSLAMADRETQAEINRLGQQQESAVAEIMRQMKELEGLLSREIARAAQERATLEADLKAKVDDTTRELENLSRVAGEFRSLVAQFVPPTTN